MKPSQRFLLPSAPAKSGGFATDCPAPRRSPLKKLVIEAGEDRVRAFRITFDHGNDDLDCRVEEVPPPKSANGRKQRHRSAAVFSALDEPGLAGIVRRIEAVLARERPMIWNLVAPGELLEPLVTTLDLRATRSLTLCKRREEAGVLDPAVVKRCYLPIPGGTSPV